MNRKKSKIRILQIILQCNGRAMFELPIENNKHPNFEWRGQGRSVDSFVLRSLIPSQQSCRRLSESQKNSYIRKKINCAHFFMLECKTTDGFLFAIFDFIMPK